MNRPPDYYKIIGSALVILLVAFGFIFMRVIFELRTDEIREILQRSDDGPDQLRSLALVTRYRLIRSRLLNPGERKEEYLQEGRIEGILSSDWDNAFLRPMPVIKVIAFHFINLVSSITGSKKMLLRGEDANQKYLSKAYLFERNREFAKAAALYGEVLRSSAPDADEVTYAYLHRGFCNSFLEKRQDALDDYRAVIKKNPTGDAAKTARILSDLLNDVDIRIRETEKMPLSEDKAIAYYRLMSYEKAGAAFDDLEKRNVRNPRLYFYRGRLREESGKLQLAVADYHRVLEMDALSDFGLNANRRLYMLGTYYGAGDQIKRDAEKIAVRAGDTTFIRKSRVFEKILEAKTIAPLSGEIPSQTNGEPADAFVKKIEMKITALEKDKKRFEHRIFLTDGSVFIGTILGREQEMLEMRTEMGIIRVAAEQILRTETIQQAN